MGRRAIKRAGAGEACHRPHSAHPEELVNSWGRVFYWILPPLPWEGRVAWWWTCCLLDRQLGKFHKLMILDFSPTQPWASPRQIGKWTVTHSSLPLVVRTLPARGPSPISGLRWHSSRHCLLPVCHITTTPSLTCLLT